MTPAQQNQPSETDGTNVTPEASGVDNAPDGTPEEQTGAPRPNQPPVYPDQDTTPNPTDPNQDTTPMPGPGPSITPPTDHQSALIREVHEKILELSNFFRGRFNPGPEMDTALIKLSELRTHLHNAVLNASPITMPTDHHLLITANPNYPKVNNSRADGDQAAASAANTHPTRANPPVAQVPLSPADDPTSARNNVSRALGSSPESAETNPNLGQPRGANDPSVAPVNVQTGSTGVVPNGPAVQPPGSTDPTNIPLSGPAQDGGAR